MAGVYANFANVSHSDYEFTITFARVDHEVEDDEIPGVVVSRINLSARFMRELIDAMQDNYSKWQTREGIKNLPEYGGGREPNERRVRLGAAPPAVATAAPIRSAVGGWVASSDVSQRGGSRSATFWSAIARSNEMNASGAPVSVERVGVGAALDRARQAVADQPDRRADHRRGQRQRGQRARRPALGRERPAQRAARRARRPARRARRRARRASTSRLRTCAELVRHHHADLVAAVAVEQRVEQDHPLGRPQPGHVGVGGGRPAAGVDRVDLPHLDAGGARQLEHVRARLALGQRREVVEHRVEHDRRERRQRARRTAPSRPTPAATTPRG